MNVSEGEADASQDSAQGDTQEIAEGSVQASQMTPEQLQAAVQEAQRLAEQEAASEPPLGAETQAREAKEAAEAAEAEGEAAEKTPDVESLLQEIAELKASLAQAQADGEKAEALRKAGLPIEYKQFLGASPGVWEEQIGLLTALRGQEAIPDVPRDPAVDVDSAADDEESRAAQARAFLGLE